MQSNQQSKKSQSTLSTNAQVTCELKKAPSRLESISTWLSFSQVGTAVRLGMPLPFFRHALPEIFHLCRKDLLILNLQVFGVRGSD